jgi:hypothetical protein
MPAFKILIKLKLKILINLAVESLIINIIRSGTRVEVRLNLSDS